jgi:type II secretory pathway component GspD/PulD (secretin)
MSGSAMDWNFGSFKMLMDERSDHTREIRRADRRFDQERDRRYFEVNVEREKALKIKETADLAALGLAREIQAYKDEKANQLREQINSERNLYVTKDQLAAEISPLRDQAQREQGVVGFKAVQLTYIVALLIVVGIVAGVLGHFIS